MIPGAQAGNGTRSRFQSCPCHHFGVGVHLAQVIRIAAATRRSC
jgi:hypothetical protein